jgi:hypothetical protein
MGRGSLALIAALVVALLVASCGGGDSSDASISKEEFIAKADVICKQSNERMEAGFAKYLKGARSLTKPNAPEVEKLVGKVMVPNLKREIAKLRALGIPDGDEERVGAMLSALEEGEETAERNPKAVTASSDAVFGIAARIAGEYGLEVCGSR